jgi:general L-amino acid transport system substrate-binding protein
MRFSLRYKSLPGFLLYVALGANSALFAGQVQAGTLEDVRKRGHIECGVTEGTPGLSVADSKGNWSGLGVDFCRALAAAVLGSKDAIKFSALSPADRIKALKSGAVDVLASTTPWTLSFDTDFGIRFAGILFYDGQGFLAKRSDVVSSVYELSGTSVCVMAGTGAEKALSDFFLPRQMKYQAVVAGRWADTVKAYTGSGCTVLTGDISTLAHERSLLNRPADHIMLPEMVSKEPLGPAVRLGDDQWFSIVRWTLMALLSAEELGVTSENAESMLTSPLLEVKRLLGTEGTLGGSLGLPADWAYQAIKQVGGYGEMFERSFGVKSDMKLDRGFNELWTKGGLMYAAPLR